MNITDEAIRAARWTREFQSLWTGRLPAGVEAEVVVRVMLEAAVPFLTGEGCDERVWLTGLRAAAADPPVDVWLMKAIDVRLERLNERRDQRRD